MYYEDSKNIGSFEDALRSVTLGTYSLQELKDDPDKASTQLLLNSGIVVLIAISIMIFRCFQHRLINKWNKDFYFPESYTVMVSNIPKEATPEDIKNAFTEK